MDFYEAKSGILLIIENRFGAKYLEDNTPTNRDILFK